MIQTRRIKKPSNNKLHNKKPQTIPFSQGWNKINKVGIKTFFSRVENIDDETKLSSISLDVQQFIEVYDTLFTMCTQREPHNHSSPLYQKHSEALTRQFKEKFIPALSSKKNESPTIFLKEWEKRWRCNKWNVRGMARMFMYLDRFHVPNSDDLLNTTEQGHTLYKQIVFEQFKETAKNAILTCIQRERNGEQQDRDLLRDCIAVFVELGNFLQKVELTIYKDDFHKYLVSESKQYYKQKSRVQLDSMSCPEYLIFAEKCINDEMSRLANYIDKYSETGLMTAVRDELLKYIQDELLLEKKSGIDNILNRTVGTEQTSAREDLARLFRLYSNVSGSLKKLSVAVRDHVTNLGMSFIATSKSKGVNADPHELIAELINLHDRFYKIVENEFESEAVFHCALKDAFETFINSEYYVSALLARYANNMLKKGSKLSCASTFDNTMDHVVMLYGYIRDKDIFERDYQMYLAKRLLENLSENEASERSMIGKLKNQAGYHWTSKLEDMFKDIQRSKELMDGFYKDENNKFQCDLSVSVCTMGAWPNTCIQPVQMTYEIGCVSDAFKRYYLSRFSGRKLRYEMDKGKADIQVIFSSKVKKILVVSTYQMLVLLLFNNKKTITFKEMIDLSGIAREELEIAVLSMAHPKIKVLRKAPNVKELCDNDKFQINPNYKNQKARVLIPLLQIKAKKIITVDAAIFTLRRHQMDAAIVRIMKARKTLQHQELITQVVHQLMKRFKPNGSDIKKRIANLIDLEYLERDQNDRQLYHYKQ